MADHAAFLSEYLRLRKAAIRLNNRVVDSIPAETMIECADALGFLEGKAIVFETEDEQSILMDYAVYYPGRGGRNAVAKFLEKSPPPAGSDERILLGAMSRAYYSLFEVLEIERGVGMEVVDLLRDEPGFLADVGLSSTGRSGMTLASRVLPMESYLMTGGASIPIDDAVGTRIAGALQECGFTSNADFEQITPQEEAEVVAVIIRQCRAKGMTSRIVYGVPGEPDPRIGREPPTESRPALAEERPATRRPNCNAACPCGSGKKFKSCHGKRLC